MKYDNSLGIFGNLKKLISRTNSLETAQTEADTKHTETESSIQSDMLDLTDMVVTLTLGVDDTTDITL